MRPPTDAGGPRRGRTSRRPGRGPPPDAARSSARAIGRSIRLASGVVWERLTTASIPNVDFLYVTYEVGGASSPEHEFQRHAGQEWGYVLSGTLGVTIGFDDVRPRAGRRDRLRLDDAAPALQRRRRAGPRRLVRPRPPVRAFAPHGDDATATAAEAGQRV